MISPDFQIAGNSVSDTMRRIEALFQRCAPELLRRAAATEKMRAPAYAPRRARVTSPEVKLRVAALMAEPDARPFAVARECGLDYDQVKYIMRQVRRGQMVTRTLGDAAHTTTATATVHA